MLGTIQSHHSGIYTCCITYKQYSWNVTYILYVSGLIPKFIQEPTSYMTFISRFNYLNRLQLELTFKADDDSGLIILLGKPVGNFVAIFLRNLYIELIYKFEHFSNTIIYPDPIIINTWNTIKVYHIKSHGYIILNEVHRIHFTNDFSFNSNYVVEKIYVGGLPKKTKTLSAFLNIGFVGCISRLVLQNQIINLSKSKIQLKGIADCNPCSNSTCNFNEFCIEKNSKFGYICICTTNNCIHDCIGLEHQKCNTIDHKLCSCEVDRRHEYAVVRNLVMPKKQCLINLTIEIQSNNNSTVILLTNVFDDLNSFLALAVIDMRFNFFIRILDTFLTVQSNKSLITKFNYEVCFGYISNYAFLRVDDEKEIRLKINPPIFNLTNLFLLGHTDTTKLHENYPKTTKFNGCISKVSEFYSDYSLNYA